MKSLLTQLSLILGCLLLFHTCLVFSTNTPPTALRFILDERGVSSSISESMTDILKFAQTPNINGSYSAPLIGEIEYALTDFVFTKLEITPVKVQFLNERNVFASSDNVQLNMKLNWMYRELRLPHVTGHGTCTVVVDSNSYIALGAQVVSLDEKGRPTFKANQVNVNLNRLKLDIHGGISGEIARVLTVLFSSRIKQACEDNMRDIMTESINYTLNERMKQWEPLKDLSFTWASLGFKLNLDSGFNDIQANSTLGNFIGSMRSVFYPVDSDEDVRFPFSPTTLPVEALVRPSTGNIIVSDFVLNSMLYSLHQSGQLKSSITPDMVPASSPIKLDTVSIGRFFPQIAQHYKENLPMQLQVSTSTYPMIDTLQGISTHLNLTIGFQVINKSAKDKNMATIEDVFTLHLNLRAILSDINIDSLNSGAMLNVSGNVHDIQFDAYVTDSTIGTVDLNAFKILFNGIVLNGIAKKYIIDFQKGFMMDMNNYLPGIRIMNPKFVSGKGFNAIGGEISWHTPAGFFVPPSLTEWNNRIDKRRMMRVIARDRKSVV